MTEKQRFNRRFKQPLNKANSKEHIASLTKIPISTLNNVWDRAYNTKINDKKVNRGAFAMGAVYQFANSVSQGGVRDENRKDYVSVMKSKQKK